MRNPQLFGVEEIKNWSVDSFNGEKWVAARPEPFFGLRIFKNLKLALGVFTGKYDVLKWD